MRTLLSAGFGKEFRELAKGRIHSAGPDGHRCGNSSSRLARAARGFPRHTGILWGQWARVVCLSTAPPPAFGTLYALNKCLSK